MSKSVKFYTFNMCCTSIKLFKKKKKKRDLSGCPRVCYVHLQLT